MDSELFVGWCMLTVFVRKQIIILLKRVVNGTATRPLVTIRLNAKIFPAIALACIFIPIDPLAKTTVFSISVARALDVTNIIAKSKLKKYKYIGTDEDEISI